MNKSLKWILVSAIICVFVVAIDQNLNGVENSGGSVSTIKIINLVAAITFLLTAFAVILSKYSKRRKN